MATAGEELPEEAAVPAAGAPRLWRRGPAQKLKGAARRSRSVAAYEGGCAAARAATMLKADAAAEARLREAEVPRASSQAAWDDAARAAKARDADRAHELASSRISEVQVLRDQLLDGSGVTSYVALLRLRLGAGAAGPERSKRLAEEAAALEGVVGGHVSRIEQLVERVAKLDEAAARAVWESCQRGRDEVFAACAARPSCFFDDDEGRSEGGDADDGTGDLDPRHGADTVAVTPDTAQPAGGASTERPRSARDLDAGGEISADDMAADLQRRFESDLNRLMHLPDDLLLEAVLAIDSRQQRILAANVAPPRRVIAWQTRGFV
ncbi:hypothetical protein M885DRAFT_525226 [Pelagophyceae sp. CCMP2097]|nr:hypothetical protein M885DRAFT_525226 [Pelagophyceae sp. CCMP2097]